MRKTKRAILASIAIFAMMAMTVPTFAASGDRSLPAENEPFWTIFSQVAYPGDSPACIAIATSYVNSQNFSADQKQGEIAGYTQMCNEVAGMPAQMESDMASEGVTSSLFANTSNWHSVNNLYFEKSGMGKIQFTNTIDFMSYRFMNFMDNFGNLVQFSDGYISLNASMVTDMKHYGAQLTMYGLNFADVPDIYVTNANGTTMHRATDSDISAVNYNATTGELTFNTTHFSAFKAVAKGSKLTQMKITKVDPKSVKYKANKSTFTINVKGGSLYKKGSAVTCVLGNSEASKVKTVKNGKRLKCTFLMSEFSVKDFYPLVISINGNGSVTKTNAVRIK